MQNKAPERIYLQYHKASERTSIMWTEYPEKNKTQIDIPYIRADLVEKERLDLLSTIEHLKSQNGGTMR